jgi:hypothetical protein
MAEGQINLEGTIACQSEQTSMRVKTLVRGTLNVRPSSASITLGDKHCNLAVPGLPVRWLGTSIIELENQTTCIRGARCTAHFGGITIWTRAFG